jgi:hypothetical protein
MRNTHFLPIRLATPEDVLAIFRDWYRFGLEYDPDAEPDYDIDFGLTVCDWINACNLIRPSALGPALGKDFGVQATRTEWLKVLEPGKQRTLKDVCEFISARRGHVPTTSCFRIFGHDCSTAGAFLTLRTMLKENGADVTGLRPSSSVNAFIKKNNGHNALLNAMCLLAPGVLPDGVQESKDHLPGKILSRTMPLGFFVLIASFLVMGGSWLSGYFGGPVVTREPVLYMAAAGAALMMGSLIALMVCERIWPTEHSHPPFETFADLARAIARYEPPVSGDRPRQ